MTTSSAPLTADDFAAIIGRRVILTMTADGIIGSNGSAVVDSTTADVVTLKIGKGIRRPVRISSVLSLGVLPDDSLAGLGAR